MTAARTRFYGESSAYSGDRIQLGVSDAEDLQSMQDEAGEIPCLCGKPGFWIYDTEKKREHKGICVPQERE